MSEQLSTAANERRRTRRHACRLRIPCSMQRLAEDGPWGITIDNLSMAGLLFHSEQPFKPGTVLTIDLPHAQQATKGRLLRISRAQPDTRRPGWSVQGTFVKPLGAEEVETIRRQFPAPVQRKRRTQVRRRTRLQAWCRTVRVREEGPWLVSVHNVSRRGIGLIADRAFEKGTFLKLELPSIRRRHLRPKLVRVTNVKPQPDGDGWVLGAVFLKELSDGEVQALL